MQICPCAKKKEEKNGPGDRRMEIKTVDNSAHMYDTVSDFPVYAVVNKDRHKYPQQDDGVQYAEIQVFSEKSRSSSKKPPVPESTEYATLQYPTVYDTKNGTLV
ncbi:hypothetical protein NDU88_006075 [Pleurodeles waltl]|uniref:Uncharacterized protein n=1 Tax=Pleurodeles waltl TaxID=8319 RepID=A0AAV7UKJ2_PLEWA|nr:hypothetical protein NDU88_006075 [Pleurodeles waltl]